LNSKHTQSDTWKKNGVIKEYLCHIIKMTLQSKGPSKGKKLTYRTYSTVGAILQSFSEIYSGNM